jgi:hypothetical protein
MRRQFVLALVPEIKKCIQQVGPQWFLLRFKPSRAMIKAGVCPALSGLFCGYSEDEVLHKCIAWLNAISFKSLHGIGVTDQVKFRVTGRFELAIRGPFVVVVSTYNKSAEPVVWLNGLQGQIPITQLTRVISMRQQVAA